MQVEVAKRGRKPIEINPIEFQNVVTELESVNKFANRSQLWAALEASDWAKNITPRPLTAQVAMMKAEKLQLKIGTPKGQRGRVKGQKPPMNAGRKKKVFSIEKLIGAIPKEERPGLEKTVEKARNGSLKARIKLKCLDCCNWQKVEVAVCECDDCPLWDVRPYKKVKTVKEKCFNDETKETFFAEKRIPLEVL